MRLLPKAILRAAILASALLPATTAAQEARVSGETRAAAPAAQSDTVVLQPDSADMATAYANPETRELVRLARGQRGVIDASVFHYTASTRQRLSVGVQALRRDRVLYRRESASRVEWWRDRPSVVIVEGAREVVPVAFAGVRVPDDLSSWAEEFLPRPGDDRLWVNPVGGGFAWHPLVKGGEAAYRYAIGDTTAIRLPDGRELRLVELRVTPRERHIRLVTGSLWIELENHAVVRAVFRPAREFDLERDLPDIAPEDADDLDEIPGFLKPIRFDVRYITVEYGFWEMRWWMPRLMAFDGWVQLGPVRMPINMELLYSDYTVEADRYGLTELPPVIRHLAGDPHSKPRPYEHGVRVIIPDDTASLLESPRLPPSVYSAGEVLMSEAELRELGDQVRSLPAAPWRVGRPRITPPWTFGRELVRYNRVEGLSAGVRGDWDLGRARLDMTARLGAADLEPRAELGVEVPRLSRTWRAAAYHRLAAVDPSARPFALGNSLSALVLGRDHGHYYQTTGAELRIDPEPGNARYEARLYAERQRAVERETDFSLAHVSGADGFRENIEARAADQLGVGLRLGVDRGLDPTGWRWGASLDLAAETGSYTFLRPGMTLHAVAPLPGAFMGGIELGAGTTLSADSGDTAVPIQSHWFLGGPATLRGFSGGEIHGRDHSRARVELATRLPAARVALFSDAGWAGRFDTWHREDVAISAGVGASFLDGLVRLDLARTLEPVERWRLELYVDAIF